MTETFWNPISFTAGPLAVFEAAYLGAHDVLVTVPIIGVLIEEEVQLEEGGAVVRTGMTRSVLAQQAEPGSRDVEAAGTTTNFVGVFQVGEEPTAELLDRARAAAG